MHAGKSSNYWNAVAEVDIPSKTDMDSVHFSIDLLNKNEWQKQFRYTLWTFIVWLCQQVNEQW